jgi:hypothetical protein
MRRRHPVLRDELVVSIAGQPRRSAASVSASTAPSRRRAARRIGRWPQRGGAPRLLLNHDPSGFELLPDACADLVCSGHTHGGHIGVQLGSTAITVVGLAGIPDQGVFERGDMRLFVTRCVGFYGYPIRLGIPPEIAC